MNYTNPNIWDTIWSRPYENYKKHHQVFWNFIRKKAYGKVLDLACGAACYWKDCEIDLYGCDFSDYAISEAVKNNPQGKFLVDDLPTHYYDDQEFDTVVLCGLINYYRNLDPFMDMVQRVIKKGGLVIITINVIDDFPDRHWDKGRIHQEFDRYGEVKAHFTDKIGWFITILST